MCRCNILYRMAAAWSCVACGLAMVNSEPHMVRNEGKKTQSLPFLSPTFNSQVLAFSVRPKSQHWGSHCTKYWMALVGGQDNKTSNPKDLNSALACTIACVQVYRRLMSPTCRTGRVQQPGPGGVQGELQHGAVPRRAGRCHPHPRQGRRRGKKQLEVATQTNSFCVQESVYYNTLVHIFSVLFLVSIFGYAIHKTYQNCRLAREVVQKSRETFTAISHYRWAYTAQPHGHTPQPRRPGKDD